MDLWIMSQDMHTFMECNALHVDGNRVMMLGRLGGRETIGIYESEKRALEILIDIKSLISGNTRKTGLVKALAFPSEKTRKLIYMMPVK